MKRGEPPMYDGYYQRLRTKPRSLRLPSVPIRVGDFVKWGGQGRGWIERTGTVTRLGLPNNKIEIVQHVTGRVWLLDLVRVRHL
jgi:hypothetical protein